jgi:hypothetical protein
MRARYLLCQSNSAGRERFPPRAFDRSQVVGKPRLRHGLSPKSLLRVYGFRAGVRRAAIHTTAADASCTSPPRTLFGRTNLFSFAQSFSKAKPTLFSPRRPELYRAAEIFFGILRR